MIERHLQSIFCDDIRHEVGGKLSYIGVYSTSLIVSAFPIILPKFCVSLRVLSPYQLPIESMTVKIIKDDEVLLQHSTSDEQLAKAASERSDTPDDEQQDRVRVFQFMTTFSPIQFDGPCSLRVRAQTETEELRGLGLKVEERIAVEDGED